MLYNIQSIVQLIRFDCILCCNILQKTIVPFLSLMWRPRYRSLALRKLSYYTPRFLSKLRGVLSNFRHGPGIYATTSLLNPKHWIWCYADWKITSIVWITVVNGTKCTIPPFCRIVSPKYRVFVFTAIHNLKCWFRAWLRERFSTIELSFNSPEMNLLLYP